MVFREMRNILRMSYIYQDNGELTKQIEQKLSINSHLAAECRGAMDQVTNIRLIENQQGIQEAMRRTEILALSLCQYIEERTNNDKNINDLAARAASMQENREA